MDVATDGMPLQPNRIYIIPPGFHCEVVRGHMLLRNDTKIGPRPSIDRLFDSLAMHEGVLVVGVVLSGTGTDGTRGLLSIKTQGGITIAQLPQSAEYESMPASAINQSAADIILAPEDMGKAINTIVNKLYGEPIDGKEKGSPIARILDLIQRKTRIDLSNYKPSTLQRRILRRANLSRASSMDDYLNQLSGDDVELNALVNDIFISITCFKRDTKLWEAMESVITDYVHNCSRNLRIWSAGCSTGEEPYSIAILLEQIKQRQQLDFEYQILATDISEKVIAQARSGIYDAEVLNNLMPDEASQFFSPVHGSFQVNKSIRDRVIFSVHNVLVDPPFSRIDLLFCRNLLIYFNTVLQEKALRCFGYSLKPKGVLTLGMSETISAQRKLFEDISSELKVYRRNNIAISFQLDSYATPSPFVIEPKKQERKTLDFLGEIHQSLGAARGVESVLINDSDEIVFKSGRCEPLTIIPEGKFSPSFFANSHPKFRAALRAMCFKARRTREQVYFQEALDLQHNLIAITVTPSTLHENWLVITQELRPLSKPDSQRSRGGEVDTSEDNQRLIEELENELNATRESLQTVVEELETTNEELQSTNEELQSSNEELQATNEELQTTNEELQSSNEELHTVNEELRTKNDELQQMSADLVALEEALEVPYVLVGTNGRVSKYSRYVLDLIDPESLHVNDLFKGVIWNTHRRDDESLIVDGVRASLESDRSAEYIMTFNNDNVYCVHIRPYQKKGLGDVSGCLIVLNDVSREFRQVLQHSVERDKAYELLDTLNSGIILTDRNGIITFVNRCANTMFDLPADALGQFFDKTVRLYNHVRQEHPEIGVFQSLTQDFKQEDFTPVDRRMMRRKGSELIYLDLNAKPVIFGEQKEPGWLISIANVTNIISLNEKIQWAAYHDSLTQLANRRYFNEYVEQCLQQRNSLGAFVYAIIDLDRFKPINDTHGHKAGDEVLVKIARAMQGVLRKSDVLARIGGDEFALILPHTSMDNAAFILDKLVKAVGQLRFNFGEKTVSSSLSIGWMSVGDEEFVTPSELYQRADGGVYEAKKLGGDRHHNVFGAATQNSSRRYLMLEEIRQALREKTFELCFQPIRALQPNGCDYRYEVLLRLQHNDGLLLPERFLAVAERYRLMPQIDRYVIEHVLKMAENNAPVLGCGISLSINLSAQTIKDRSITDFIDRIDVANLALGCIVFEISETSAVEDTDDVRHFIDFAHSKGFKIALDNFGTSYCSFHLLKMLPVDFVKVDGHFIATLCDDPTDQAFVESLLKIARMKGFQVVAEWVDNREKHDYLAELGIDYMQGFFIDAGHSEAELLKTLTQLRADKGTCITSCRNRTQ